mgnify:CR=1 FL=1
MWLFLDFSGNGIFNTLDIILIWCYSVTAVVFYKTVIKKVLGKWIYIIRQIMYLCNCMNLIYISCIVRLFSYTYKIRQQGE